MKLGRNICFIKKKWLEKIWEKKCKYCYMFCMLKTEKIYTAYVSKHNSNREKGVIFLMIPNGEGRKAKPEGWWHYLAVKKWSALLRGIT